MYKIPSILKSLVDITKIIKVFNPLYTYANVLYVNSLNLLFYFESISVDKMVEIEKVERQDLNSELTTFPKARGFQCHFLLFSSFIAILVNVSLKICHQHNKTECMKNSQLFRTIFFLHRNYIVHVSRY